MVEQVTIHCPVCGKEYQVPPGMEQPTCGDPACIKTARSRKMPFMAQAVAPEESAPAEEPTGKKLSRKKKGV